MDITTIDIDDARIQWAKLLSLVRQGNQVVITQNQEPVVQLTPIPQHPQKRIAGLHRGAIRMRDDFNEPLPDAFWLGQS
jgi:prevent-host-death family protein